MIYHNRLCIGPVVIRAGPSHFGHSECVPLSWHGHLSGAVPCATGWHTSSSIGFPIPIRALDLDMSSI